MAGKSKVRVKSKVVKARAAASSSAPAAAGKPQEKGGAKVIEYGKGNKLPQEITKVFLGSPTARRCWLKLKKFIQADGFANATAAAVQVNPKQKADDLLPLLAWDAAVFGIALRVKYNLAGEVAEVYHVPFHTVRKLDDGRFLVNATLGTDNHKADQDEVLDAYDPSPKAVKRALAQVGIDKKPQPGQILYLFEETSAHPHYPEPAAWAGKEDMLSDTEIPRADHNAIRKRVKPNIAVYFPYQIDDVAKDEDGLTDWDKIDETVRQLTDPEGEGDAVVIDGESKEAAPQLISIDSMKPTLSMDAKSDTITKRVCRHMGLHPVLIGLDTAGQLGNTQQLLNIIQLTQQEVLDAQGMIQRAFQLLLPAFDWTISSLNIIKALPEQVWQTMKENEKRNFIGLPEEETNEQLDKLSRLPEELKKKIMDSLTPEQALKLAGIELEQEKEETDNAQANHKGRFSRVRAFFKKY